MASNTASIPDRTLTTTAWQRAEEDVLDKSAIAEIPSGLFSKMSREELICVIRAARLPLVDSRMIERLSHLDRMTLERLAHLAQRCCRNQGY